MTVVGVVLVLLLRLASGLLASFSLTDAERMFPSTRAYMSLAMPQYKLQSDDDYKRFHCIVSHNDAHGFNFYFHRNRILMGVLWAPRANKTACFSELRAWFRDHFSPLPLAATLTMTDDVVAWHESDP